ncbi:Maf-like protein [Gautieria morchelliformis]|nr:Maf-like protein [Gautieria morchelliformis]
MKSKHQAVLDHALRVPGTNKLAGKRVVLASSSPRRKAILKTLGLAPEVVPSTFDEDLSHSSFDNVYEYPVATATEKAVEVYERLVREQPEDGPDLVIGADTVVLSHYAPATSTTPQEVLPQTRPDILEKPLSKADNLRMLLELNGGTCEVVTGVSLVYPIVTAPGYSIKSIEERTVVHFAENSLEVLQAYADSGEGVDRAGGFAVQGLGGLLIRKIDGDYSNVVGFPGASFFKFLDTLVEEEDDFLDI